MKERIVLLATYENRNSTVRLKRNVILSLVECSPCRLVCFGNLMYQITGLLSNQDYITIERIKIDNEISAYTYNIFSTEYGNCALLP